MNPKLLGIGIAFLILSGCIALPIPHERQLSPLYFGTVTDAETGKPIEAVVVTVSGNLHSERPIPGETKTDVAGGYRVVAKEKASWFVLIAGPADGSCGGFLLFVHPNYEMKMERTDEATAGGADGMCTDVKRQLDVSLKPKGI